MTAARGTGSRPGWGVLGTGGIAGIVAGDLVADGSRVVAVGSRVQERADGFARVHGIGRAHASAQALVDDPAVDIVYVASPHTLHAEHALLALDAGKHVLIEKPLALNAREARKVAGRATDAGLVALEAMWSHYLPHMQRVRELLADHALGTIRSVVASHEQRLPADPSHRLRDPALGGGALLDLGCYPVWFAHAILGQPATVQAISTPTPTGVDATTSALLSFESGAQAAFVCGMDARGSNSATVTGTAARLELHRTWYQPTSFAMVDSHGATVELFDGRVPGRGRQYQARAFEARLRTGSPDGTLGIEESIAALRTLDRIRELIGLVYPGEEDSRTS